MRLIPIGQVVAAHGVRGEIKFRYYNALGAGTLRYPALVLEQDGKEFELRPSLVRRHKGFFLIKFKELDSLEEVSFLLGRELSVRENDLPLLKDDEWYDYQLIGLQVVDEQGKRVGKVTEVLHTKANDILAVTGEKEFLLPLIDEYVTAVDLEGSCLTIMGGALVE